MMRRQSRFKHLSMVVVCSSLGLLILITMITDFPKRSIVLYDTIDVMESKFGIPAYNIDNNDDSGSENNNNNNNNNSIDNNTDNNNNDDNNNNNDDDDNFTTNNKDNIRHPNNMDFTKGTTTTTEMPETVPQDDNQTDNSANIDRPRTRLLSDDKMVEIEKRFQTRRDHIMEQCENMPRRQIYKCEADDVTSCLKHVEDSNLVYCAIEKTGSTFWRRILHLASGWGNDSSPYSVDPSDVYSKNNSFQNLVNVSYDDLADIFQTSESIMFVRDPLSRLFSAWLDKFYSTNPYYWSNYGRKIIRYERRNATNTSRTYGHDVTFPEFVDFISRRIKSRMCLDVHFSPNFKHCMPCYLSYDYIGKYETLKEDTYYLLEKLNLSDVVHFTNFEKDATTDVIENDASWVFKKKNETKDCIPFRCGLFRVWKRLQSRGIISKHLEFPYKTNKQADSITVQDFTKAIKEAHTKSDSTEITNNREEAMSEAFRLLPEVVKTRMLDALGPDFDLFDYDRNPSFLQGNSSQDAVLEYITECPFTFEDP